MVVRRTDEIKADFELCVSIMDVYNITCLMLLLTVSMVAAALRFELIQGIKRLGLISWPRGIQRS